MQELLERAFNEGKAPAHAALLVRGFSSAWLGSGIRKGWHEPFGQRQTDDASPSLCRPASLRAIVNMNQAADTHLFKVGQQPPNQLHVPKALVLPHHQHLPLQLPWKLALVKGLL